MWETWVESSPLIPPLSAAAPMADPPFALNYNSTGGWIFRRKGETDREEGEREREGKREGGGFLSFRSITPKCSMGWRYAKSQKMGFVNLDSTLKNLQDIENYKEHKPTNNDLS